MPLDIETAGDRPAIKSTIEEIMVTPEMIEAGMERLWVLSIDSPEDEMRREVKRIYREMHAVRPRSTREVQVSCRIDV